MRKIKFEHIEEFPNEMGEDDILRKMRAKLVSVVMTLKKEDLKDVIEEQMTGDEKHGNT